MRAPTPYQSENAILRNERTIQLTPSVTDRDHVYGPDDATLTLVLYGDDACPYTRTSLVAVHAVQQRLGDQLRFVFRTFPLTEIHPHALQAAEAAEAAAAQGCFWQMHAYLFAHQQSLEQADVLQYARNLSLDTARFEQDLATHASLGRINGDVERGLLSGVHGTPTFFINGVLHTASWEQESLAAALQRANAQRRI